MSVTTRFVGSRLPLKQFARQNGSGFLINKRTLVTALHVVKSMNGEIAEYPVGIAGIYVERNAPDGSSVFSVPAIVKITDEENDIAILDVDPDGIREYVDSGELRILEISREEPKAGQEIVMSGFRGKEPSPFTTFGAITLVADGTDGEVGVPKRRIYANLTSLAGNSGSPILSAASGNVIGIQLGALKWGESTSGMSYGAHPKAVAALLSEYFVLNSNATK